MRLTKDGDLVGECAPIVPRSFEQRNALVYAEDPFVVGILFWRGPVVHDDDQVVDAVDHPSWQLVENSIDCSFELVAGHQQDSTTVGGASIAVLLRALGSVVERCLHTAEVR